MDESWNPHLLQHFYALPKNKLECQQIDALFAKLVKMNWHAHCLPDLIIWRPKLRVFIWKICCCRLCDSEEHRCAQRESPGDGV